MEQRTHEEIAEVTRESPSVPPDVKRRLFETMVLIKACEDRLAEGIRSGAFPVAVWGSRGQEAVGAIGVCLRPSDRLVTTYRGLHDWISKGVPLTEILGEILGRQVGACRGKSGTMHIVSPEQGLMLSTGIVGAGPPVAVGLALAARHQKSDRVVAVTFGDGATNTGSFHEAMNLASVWSLPVVFVCINNLYAEMTPIAMTMKIEQVVDRRLAYAMPGERVDGNDPVAVYGAVSAAVSAARAGEGPTFIEAVTYRYNGHYYGDPMTYIPAEELEAHKADDPMIRYRQRLLDEGMLDADALRDIEATAAQRVSDALAEVLASPMADAEELYRDVYASDQVGSTVGARR